MHAWTTFEGLPGLWVLVVSGPGGLVCVNLKQLEHPPDAGWASDRMPGVALSQDPDGGGLREAVRQLTAYFRGELRTFNLPLGVGGTPFQSEVWQTLQSIPYGQTRSYAWLAARLGRPNATRAVGTANGRNPLAVVVPCHRVIGADGGLRGYAGGVGIKRILLDLESQALKLEA